MPPKTRQKIFQIERKHSDEFHTTFLQICMGNRTDHGPRVSVLTHAGIYVESLRNILPEIIHVQRQVFLYESQHNFQHNYMFLHNFYIRVCLEFYLPQIYGWQLFGCLMFFFLSTPSDLDKFFLLPCGRFMSILSLLWLKNSLMILLFVKYNRYILNLPTVSIDTIFFTECSYHHAAAVFH